MTTPFQLRHLRLRYESIPKQFRSRWLIGLLLGGGLTGVGFGIYRAIVPAQNASQLIYNSATKAMLERPTGLSSFKRWVHEINSKFKMDCFGVIIIVNFEL